jgi:putative phosphoribosyl transferase
MNREAMARMRCGVVLEIVAGATHLFEGSGALDRAAALAAWWFERYLARDSVKPESSRSSFPV